MTVTRRFVIGSSLAALALTSGCVGGAGGGAFRTDYDRLDPSVTRGWRLAGVRVTAPRSLVVSEERSWEPVADIVWREDKLGDRYAQVEKIMTTAISRGARGLHGGVPVRLEATMQRFHAMTFEAEALNFDVGVHNIDFNIRVVNAATGAVLAGPVAIEASFPAKTGARMAEARSRGESQKSQITAHVAATIAGWLGTGPDNRGTFSRSGA